MMSLPTEVATMPITVLEKLGSRGLASIFLTRQREDFMARPSLKRLYKREAQEMADIETASVIQV